MSWVCASANVGAETSKRARNRSMPQFTSNPLGGLWSVRRNNSAFLKSEVLEVFAGLDVLQCLVYEANAVFDVLLVDHLHGGVHVAQGKRD